MSEVDRFLANNYLEEHIQTLVTSGDMCRKGRYIFEVISISRRA